MVARFLFLCQQEKQKTVRSNIWSGCVEWLKDRDGDTKFRTETVMSGGLTERCLVPIDTCCAVASVRVPTECFLNEDTFLINFLQVESQSNGEVTLQSPSLCGQEPGTWPLQERKAALGLGTLLPVQEATLPDAQLGSQATCHRDTHTPNLQTQHMGHIWLWLKGVCPPPQSPQRVSPDFNSSSSQSRASYAQ